jgi:type IV fimbrial biogenesis protein FimT
MQCKRFTSFQRGLTLIEICVVLAIISILVGTAAPSFKEVKQRRMLDGVASEIAADLYFARSEAVARQEGVRYTTQAVAGGSCALIHTGSNGDCQCSAAGVAQCSGSATLVKNAFYPSPSGINVGVNVSAIRFDPKNGMATPAGSITVSTASGHALRHVVNMMGRVRTCSPGATTSMAKPC